MSMTVQMWEMSVCGNCLGDPDRMAGCKCNYGIVWLHRETGKIALYPGGPFVGTIK
jgi:hypothetical protein